MPVAQRADAWPDSAFAACLKAFSLTSAPVSVEGNVDVVVNTSPGHGESRCSRDVPLSHVTPFPEIMPQSSR